MTTLHQQSFLPVLFTLATSTPSNPPIVDPAPPATLDCVKLLFIGLNICFPFLIHFLLNSTNTNNNPQPTPRCLLL